MQNTHVPSQEGSRTNWVPVACHPLGVERALTCSCSRLLRACRCLSARAASNAAFPLLPRHLRKEDPLLTSHPVSGCGKLQKRSARWTWDGPRPQLGQAGGTRGAWGPSPGCHSAHLLCMTTFGPDGRREGSALHPGAPAHPEGPLCVGGHRGPAHAHAQPGAGKDLHWGTLFGSQ